MTHLKYWGISSIGRVRALQARGTGIETPILHFFDLEDNVFALFASINGSPHALTSLLMPAWCPRFDSLANDLDVELRHNGGL